MARACGHESLSGFEKRDLTTWKMDIADFTGVEYGRVSSPRSDTSLNHQITWECSISNGYRNDIIDHHAGQSDGSEMDCE
jgi:hypothetical protein